MLQPDGPDVPPLTRGTVGKTDWHELHSTDWESGFAFYSKLFGWSKTTAMDMGPMGTYQLFTMAGNGDDGGLMNEPPNAGPAPYWMFYFSVDAIDAAHKRITDAGGAVMMGPHEVPGGAWIITGTDPQGAMFSVVAPKR
jgi:predicted enzyme related to lactoylglutathione lyase